MTPTRAQLDAAEAWLLEEWLRVHDVTHTQSRRLRKRRDILATAIRAIRAQRKALDAECDGWELVHINELSALRASAEFACITPDEDCECAGCMAAAEAERERT